MAACSTGPGHARVGHVVFHGARCGMRFLLVSLSCSGGREFVLHPVGGRTLCDGRHVGFVGEGDESATTRHHIVVSRAAAVIGRPGDQLPDGRTVDQLGIVRHLDRASRVVDMGVGDSSIRSQCALRGLGTGQTGKAGSERLTRDRGIG
jgi:hypothetical protein